MRSCYQNGVGSKQFSDVLRVQHVLKYDKTRLQYLHHTASRKQLDAWRDQVHDGFLPLCPKWGLGSYDVRQVYRGACA